MIKALISKYGTGKDGGSSEITAGVNQNAAAGARKKKVKLEIADRKNISSIDNYHKAGKYITNGYILYDGNYFDFNREVTDNPNLKQRSLETNIINAAEKYNVPLEDPREIPETEVAKGLSGKTKSRKIVLFKAGNNTVAIDKKYYDNIKNFSLYNDGNPNSPIAIRNKNGDTVGVVMPIAKGHGSVWDWENGTPVKQSKIRYQSAAMKRSEYDNISDFYNDVKNTPAGEKKQFNAHTKNGLNIRIPHDTILHEQKKHKLTAPEWQTLIDNIDNVANAAVSKRKSKYDGKSVLLKIKTGDKTYGVVLETFPKNNPLISTAFIDNEINIDNWIENEGIKNEAIPSGTKTSFLGIHLNDIIAQIQPEFKSKQINSQSTGNPQKPVNNKQDLVDKYYKQCSGTEMTDEQAKETAVVISEIISATADNLEISLNEADKLFGMNIKSLTVEEAQKTMEKNIYFQAGYHGTPHRFDKFSNDYIGTGEGNQAHGHGLYRNSHNVN